MLLVYFELDFYCLVACKNQFRNWFLQVKNPVCQTWFFKLDFSKIKYRWIGQKSYNNIIYNVLFFRWPSEFSLYVHMIINKHVYVPPRAFFQNYAPFLCADTDLYCNTCVHHIIEWWSKMQKQIFIRDVTAFE